MVHGGKISLGQPRKLFDQKGLTNIPGENPGLMSPFLAKFCPFLVKLCLFLTKFRSKNREVWPKMGKI